MRRLLALALMLTLLFAHNASAAVSYSTAGDVYLQNFNSPTVPAASNPFREPAVSVQYNGSAHIQNGNAPWAGGWKDDYTTNETYLGLPGWYLWHDQVPTNSVFTEVGENSWWSTSGANGHAQFRYGGGNATSGTGFFFFTNTTCTTCGEKALGIRSASFFSDSNAGNHSYIGLQLINNTGGTLNSFTITYDGEQFSEAGGNSQDGFDLQWSLVTTAAGWKSSSSSEPGGFYDGVSGVDYGGFANSYASLINNNPVAAVSTYDPNLVDGCFNCTYDITHTVSGIVWEPGDELWIRWRDGDAHDGIGIDNVRFTASTGVVAPLLGDFNSDGKVDAGDYATWRKNEGPNATLPNDNGLTNQADRFTLWRSNFGNPSGAGSGSGLGGANVPEPSAIALVLLCLAALPFKRGRVR